LKDQIANLYQQKQEDERHKTVLQQQHLDLQQEKDTALTKLQFLQEEVQKIQETFNKKEQTIHSLLRSIGVKDHEMEQLAAIHQKFKQQSQLTVFMMPQYKPFNWHD